MSRKFGGGTTTWGVPGRTPQKTTLRKKTGEDTVKVVMARRESSPDHRAQTSQKRRNDQILVLELEWKEKGKQHSERTFTTN